MAILGMLARIAGGVIIGLFGGAAWAILIYHNTLGEFVDPLDRWQPLFQCGTLGLIIGILVGLPWGVNSFVRVILRHNRPTHR